MESLKNFKFSAWNDGDRQACYIEADVPSAKLGRIYFYMSRKEFEEFVSGHCSLEDIHHYLRSFGDLATFFDMDVPNKSYGEMTIPYVNVNFPLFVRRILLKWAEKQWNSAVKCHMNRPAISISNKKLENWSRLYGVGTGNFGINIFNERAQELFDGSQSGNFNDKLEYLTTIAKNHTNAFFQKVNVNLYRDGNSFNFDFKKLSFKQDRFVGFHGGLINHGKDEPDWNIHT